MTLALVGCTAPADPPEILVKNLASLPVRGMVDMWLDPQWYNRTDQLTGHWEFEFTGRGSRSLGRLPAEPAEYHYMVVITEDGREGWGRILNYAHASELVIEIREESVLLRPQGVT